MLALRLDVEEIHRRYQRPVYALALRMTRNAADAEDLTQESFLTVLRNVGSFRGEAAFSSWLYRLAANVVKMHFRRRRARIVSHIIVLFDFVEEKHAESEPLVEALLDAGIMRLRPVLITVGATVITLLRVPVLYSIFVLDLKLVKWETAEPRAQEPETTVEAATV